MYEKSNERFNELIKYIEENLTENIEYKKLAKILAVNEYTLHRIFLFVTNLTLAEYIRKRRISMSALDLLKGEEKIIDIAIKYQYDSPISFARAFKKMMGFNPSEINANKEKIKYFPIIQLDDSENIQSDFVYKRIQDKSFEFYTISRQTTLENVYKMTPEFWEDSRKKINVNINYGLFEYDKISFNDRMEATYYIASTEKFDNATIYKINNQNYIVFNYKFIDSKNLNQFIKRIYKLFIPTSGYELDDGPDVEEYFENNEMNIYIPIK